jgi:hypothetical protein
VATEEDAGFFVTKKCQGFIDMSLDTTGMSTEGEAVLFFGEIASMAAVGTFIERPLRYEVGE